MKQSIKEELDNFIKLKTLELQQLSEQKKENIPELAKQYLNGRWCGIGSVLCDLHLLLKRHKEI